VAKSDDGVTQNTRPAFKVMTGRYCEKQTPFAAVVRLDFMLQKLDRGCQSQTAKRVFSKSEDAGRWVLKTRDRYCGSGSAIPAGEGQ
jgi:hypothetical protein